MEQRPEEKPIISTRRPRLLRSFLQLGVIDATPTFLHGPTPHTPFCVVRNPSMPTVLPRPVSNLANIGSILARYFGPCVTDFGPILADIGDNRLNPARTARILIDIGRNRSNFGRHRPMLADSGPNVADVGQHLPNVGRAFAQCLAKLGSLLAELCQFWPHSAQIRLNRSQIWPTDNQWAKLRHMLSSELPEGLLRNMA